jgi:ketopantoate reductase
VLDDDGTVVTLKNGISHVDTIHEYLQPRQVLSGITMQGGMTRSRGHIVHTNDGIIKLGGPDEDSAREVRSVLDEAGFSTTVVVDPAAWSSRYPSSSTSRYYCLSRWLITCRGVSASS